MGHMKPEEEVIGEKWMGDGILHHMTALIQNQDLPMNKFMHFFQPFICFFH